MRTLCISSTFRNIHLNIHTATMILVAILFCSCHHDDEDIDPVLPKINHRTVLVYMAAENSLYPFVKGYGNISGDLNEMIEGCKNIPDSCELLVYVDDLSNPRIYVIDNKTTATKPLELVPELQYDDDSNSASPEVLNQMLKYMTTKHKAHSYGVVLWSHGTGWIESEYKAESKSRGGKKTAFGIDNQNNAASDDGPGMEISDLANVLEQYDSINFILFDACFMQSIEVLYTLRNSADYIIGSPAEIPGLGAPYDSIMSSMFSEPFDPNLLAWKYYEYYKYVDQLYEGALLSAVDTRQLENFAKSTREAIGDLDLRDGEYMDVQDYFVYDYWRVRALYAMPDFYDMKGIMMKNLPEDRYNTWLKALDKLVVAKYATESWYTGYYGVDVPVDSAQYSGVSMYVPLQKYVDRNEVFTGGYYKTDWYNAITNK